MSLEEILNQAQQAFNHCNTLNDLEVEKAKFLGKSGSVTTLLKGLASLSIEEKKQQGAEINVLKKAIEDVLEQAKTKINNQILQQKLNAEKIDVTLSGRKQQLGSLHPVMITQDRIEQIFSSLGFRIAQGPEIETDWFNFTALNSPLNHPARSMQDTFYLENVDTDGQNLLLRTHTSPIQVRYAQQHVQKHADKPLMPDIRIIAPGRTYRVDSDATHSPMFNQVEGLWIGTDVSFADLKAVYTKFLRVFFEDDSIEVRFRPSYFPFTEPSAEIDMAFSRNNQQKWLEISGAGQVHPKVLENMGIDSNKYMGIAFGSGLERLTMLKYGISDLRLFFEGDTRFLQQFAKA
jgi:phenylalanyl-tRNA synthetase alpha chain